MLYFLDSFVQQDFFAHLPITCIISDDGRGALWPVTISLR